MNVEWVKASKPHDEKVRVEATIRDAILEFFSDGVECAKKAYDHSRNGNIDPFSDWNRAVNIGHRAVKSFVSPTEYKSMAFKVTFEEGLR